MRLLLDTQILIALIDDRRDRLGAKIDAALSAPESTCSISVASLWEIAIKTRLGKLGLNSRSRSVAGTDRGDAFRPVADIRSPCSRQGRTRAGDARSLRSAPPRALRLRRPAPGHDRRRALQSSSRFFCQRASAPPLMALSRRNRAQRRPDRLRRRSSRTIRRGRRWRSEGGSRNAARIGERNGL